MRVMKNSISVQARGCAALGNLALTDSTTRNSIAEKGGIELILEAMQLHSDHGPVQAWGCDALANLSLDLDLQIMITKAGAIEIVLEAMAKHENNPEVQQWGCDAMVGLAHGNVENQSAFARAGGIETVVSAMQNKHLLRNASFQEKACRSLAYLAANNVENQKAISQAGGPKVVLEVKEAHRDDTNVQEWATKCLSILATDASAVLAAMRCYKNCGNVQQWGCNALGHLAHVTSNGCDEIVSLHGVDTILQAMAHHENDVWISLSGCETLWVLVYQNAKYKRLVGHKNGVERILKTMRNFLGHAPLQKWGCAALASLCVDIENSKMLARENGVETIVRAMKAHWSVADVQQHACAALLVVGAMDASNVHHVLKAGGVCIRILFFFSSSTLTHSINQSITLYIGTGSRRCTSRSSRQRSSSRKWMLGVGSALTSLRKFRNDRWFSRCSGCNQGHAETLRSTECSGSRLCYDCKYESKSIISRCDRESKRCGGGRESDEFSHGFL